MAGDAPAADSHSNQSGDDDGDGFADAYGQPHAHQDRITDRHEHGRAHRHADGDSDAHCHAGRHRDGHRHALANAGANSHRDADDYAIANADRDAHGRADRDTDRHADGHVDGYAIANANRDAHGRADRDANCYGNRDADRDRDANANAHGDAGANRDADRNTGAHWDHHACNDACDDACGDANSEATPTRTPGIWLNELLPAPAKVDWDGDKKLTARDEWVEIRNSTGRAADLSGWTLEASGGGAKRVFRLPRRTTLPAGGFLVLYDRQTRLSMEDTGGQVSLYNAAGKLMDTVRYGALRPDSSYSLGRDWIWRTDWPPSPGRVNLPPPTPTPAASDTVTPTATP